MILVCYIGLNLLMLLRQETGCTDHEDHNLVKCRKDADIPQGALDEGFLPSRMSAKDSENDC